MARPLDAFLHRDRSKERTRARRLLDQVGIADAADALPEAIPLGYLKRLEVVRAFATRPRLLLLDEPLAGLSQGEARGMADLIAHLGWSRPDYSLDRAQHPGSGPNMPGDLRTGQWGTASARTDGRSDGEP